MTDTPIHEDRPDYVHRMADDGSGGLDTPAAIKSALSTEAANLGNVVTTVGALPGTAEIRPAGIFSDPMDVKEYLERGGLLVDDGLGNTAPQSFVWLLEFYDDVLQTTVWQVYVDTDTN